MSSDNENHNRNVTDPQIDASGHSNIAYINCDDIVEIAPILGSLRILGGQPQEFPPSFTKSGSTWKIDLWCGRKKAGWIADDFSSVTGGSIHEFGIDSSDRHPRELNFFFEVDIIFKISEDRYSIRMAIGQGSTVFFNNWWIGSRSLVADRDKKNYLLPLPTSANLIRQMYLISGSSSNHFDFKKSLGSLYDLKQYPDWLSGMDQTTPINRINLPGTHDTAAIQRKLALIDAWACHRLTIKRQLLAGIRLLDLRIAVSKKDGKYVFDTCHGNQGSSVSLHKFQSLKSAFDEIFLFLNDHKGEFVAVSLKIDYDEGLPASGYLPDLRSFLLGYRVYKSGSIPAINQVKGQVYLINRIDETMDFGVPIKFPNNIAQYVAANSIRLFEAYVQDIYKYYGDYDRATDDKYVNFKAAMSKYSDDLLVLNFASGFKSQALTGAPFKIYIMSELLRYFGKKVGIPEKFGWSFFDFEDSGYTTDIYKVLTVIDLIIDSNFSFKSYPDKFKVG